MKVVIGMGRSKGDLKAFPADARRDAGYPLDRLQRGEKPENWNPMKAAGQNVRETRINKDSGTLKR